MSIEPIGRVDSNTTPLIELQQLFQVYHGDHHRHPAAEDGFSALTAGDRELLATLYGPRVLTAASTSVERPGMPQFLLDVIADRQNGVLPIGTELTSTYVQAKFEAHVNLNGTVSNPLTEQNLADAQAYFHDRVQGAAIDLQV